MVPGIRDNDDKAIELLAEILTELRGSSPGTGTDNNSSGSASGSNGAGGVPAPLHPSRYIVVETAALDESNEDGTMTIQPGESETIAEYESGGDYPINLLAVGATDRRDVSYRLVYDNDQTLGGWTQSPLGSVNDPFSFADVLGRTIPVEKRIRYEARLLDSADSSVDLAARLHTEV